MSFARRYGADTTQIVTTGDHNQVARVKLYVVLDLVVLQVESQSVVDLEMRVRVAECAAVVGDEHWYALGAHKQFLYFTELVLKK